MLREQESKKNLSGIKTEKKRRYRNSSGAVGRIIPPALKTNFSTYVTGTRRNQLTSHKVSCHSIGFSSSSGCVWAPAAVKCSVCRSGSGVPAKIELERKQRGAWSFRCF